MKEIIENILYTYNNYNLQTFEIDLDKCPDTNLKIDSKLNTSSFLKELESIKNNYIQEYNKVTSDIDSRRIAILVTKCYLKNGGDVYKADSLERNIYDAVRSLHFKCFPIPKETRIEEEYNKNRNRKRKKEDIKRKALRLGIEVSEKVLVKYQDLTYFVINQLLSKNEEDIVNGQSRSEHIKLNQRGSNSKTIPSQQGHYLYMEDQKELTLCKVRLPNLLSGTGFYELDSKNKKRG